MPTICQYSKDSPVLFAMLILRLQIIRIWHFPKHIIARTSVKIYPRNKEINHKV